jgi:hypothetical protein
LIKIKNISFNILIIFLNLFLVSCLKTPYSRPDSYYNFDAVANNPEGVIFFNKNKRNQAIVFYKKSLSVLYAANLFSKLDFNIRQCSEYIEITSCVWSASIVLSNVEASYYGNILFNDYWEVEDEDGLFYIRSMDSDKRLQRLLNSNQPYIKFSYSASYGNTENIGKFVSARHVKNNYIKVDNHHVEVFKKPSRVNRVLNFDMR